MVKDTYNNFKRKEDLKESTSSDIEYCDICDGVLNWNIIPTILHREYTPCNCIVCKCGNKEEEKFSPIWDEDNIYQGLQCDVCKLKNVEELSIMELSMMSKE